MAQLKFFPRRGVFSSSRDFRRRLGIFSRLGPVLRAGEASPFTSRLGRMASDEGRKDEGALIQPEGEREGSKQNPLFPPLLWMKKREVLEGSVWSLQPSVGRSAHSGENQARRRQNSSRAAAC